MYPFTFNDTPPWFGVQDLASLRHACLVFLWDFVSLRQAWVTEG